MTLLFDWCDEIWLFKVKLWRRGWWCLLMHNVWVFFFSETRFNCFAFLRIKLVPAFRVFQNFQDVWIRACFFHLLMQTLLCKEGNLKFCPNTALKVELTFFSFSRIKFWWFSFFPFLIDQPRYGKIIWKTKTWKERKHYLQFWDYFIKKYCSEKASFGTENNDETW